MPVLLRVSGRWACFTRPDLKAESVTYDVMTPTAAKAILECIYRKPEMKWVVDGIYVLNPIKTISLLRNGIKNKISQRNVLNKSQKPFDCEKMRDQRNATILTNVDYVIEAHFEVVSGTDNPGKHLSIFLRRASRGQCFRHPYFGCREFSVDLFQPIRENEIPQSALQGKKELGYVLHSIDYGTYTPAFFKAEIVDGYMSVPPPNDPKVKR
jgi:CRISPR-associated protein Cas5d